MKLIIKKTVLLVALLSLAASCSEVPLENSLNSTVDYYVNNQSAVPDLIRAIAKETKSVDVASNNIENKAILDALVDAKKRGISVRVVMDNDNANSDSVKQLRNAGIGVKLIDGSLEYLPDPNFSHIVKDGVIKRKGELNQLTHNFVLLGETEVWNFDGHFGKDDGSHTGFHVTSQLLHEDFLREFNQLFAGVDSVALDIYNGPIKSSFINHPYYDGDKPFYYKDAVITAKGGIRFLFSPRDKVVKTIIDRIYEAKTSIFVQTESLEDPNFINALNYKKIHGKLVNVVVSQRQDSKSAKNFGSLSSRVFKLNSSDFVPTIIIIDERPSKKGVHYPRTSIVLSMPLLHTNPFTVVSATAGDDSIVLYKSDYFNDGNAWIIHENTTTTGSLSIINDLVLLFNINRRASKPYGKI